MTVLRAGDVQYENKLIAVPFQLNRSVEQAVQLAFFMGGEYVQGLIADTGAAAPAFKKLIDRDRYLIPAHRRKIVLDGHAYSGFDN
ncbi:MAG: hypothetical protein HY332_08460 [Chloroflexi bacterium]|nr:hypothetical protein [Chloroflexota bacterium]